MEESSLPYEWLKALNTAVQRPWFVWSYYWGSEDAILLPETTLPDWHGYFDKHVEPNTQE